jgi:hypothetical protein
MTGLGPTDPAEEHFNKGLWGHDTSVWRKLALLWGYSDRYLNQQQDTSDVAANYTINLAGVPAGEVWRIQGVGVYRTAVAGQYARLQVYNGSTAVSIEDIAIATAGRFINNSRELVLKAGDNIRVVYIASVVDEVLITGAWGYKMAVQ